MKWTPLDNATAEKLDKRLVCVLLTPERHIGIVPQQSRTDTSLCVTEAIPTTI